ncbi:MAG: ABC transporter ATP-binding protein [Spirochaetales bacterium]|nr:ABC transporter ATP-binding protein [Spirochaetales bacterium]
MIEIKVEGLAKEYRSESGVVSVLNDLQLVAPRGSVLSVEGASGSGKSTFLNIIGTLDFASKGHIFLNDVDLSVMQERARERFRSTELGFVFQQHNLLPDFTVLENVMMPVLIQRRPRKEARREAEEKLKMVGLEHRLDHYPAQVSGGELARAGVARALVGGKKMILADEPTGNLDRSNSEKLADLLFSLQKELGFTLLIVTHDGELAGRVPLRYRLRTGRLEQIV